MKFIPLYKWSIVIIIVTLWGATSSAQNVGISTTGAIPAATNLFEVLQSSTTANSIGIDVLHSGAITGTGYGFRSQLSGVSTTSIAAYLSATGATNNYSLIVPSGGGNVGIGTTTPNAGLDINGTTIGWNGNITGIEANITGINAPLNGGGNLRVLSSTSQAIDAGGSAVFGGYHTGQTISIDFAEIAGRKENGTAGNTAGYFAIGTRPNALNIVERLRITSGGNVGIGTTSPVQLLGLSGTNDVAAHFETQVAGSPVNSGPNFPGTNVDAAGIGSITWSTPSNVALSNNSYAVAATGTSHYLKTTNYGFSIPANATVKGIQVDVERSKTGAGGAVSLAGAWTTSKTSYTVGAGSNRIILVALSEANSPNSPTVTSVTWGGQSFTKVTSLAFFTISGMEMWYLNEAKIILAGGGTNNIITTWSPAAVCEKIAAVTLVNVDQTTPISSTGSGVPISATSATLGSALAVNNGDMMVYSSYYWSALAHTESVGYTEGTDDNVTACSNSLATATKAIRRFVVKPVYSVPLW